MSTCRDPVQTAATVHGGEAYAAFRRAALSRPRTLGVPRRSAILEWTLWLAEGGVGRARRLRRQAVTWLAGIRARQTRQTLSVSLGGPPVKIGDALLDDPSVKMGNAWQGSVVTEDGKLLSFEERCALGLARFPGAPTAPCLNRAWSHHGGEHFRSLARVPTAPCIRA